MQSSLLIILRASSALDLMHIELDLANSLVVEQPGFFHIHPMPIQVHVLGTPKYHTNTFLEDNLF